MALQNKWVTYLDRSYKNIKASILERAKIIVPEMTDHSESNLFVIIVSIFAGLVEQLNYYIDNVARETYITTARRYSSMISITRLIDYRVKAKVPAMVDLKVTAYSSTGDPIRLEDNYIFDKGLIISTDSGINFVTTKKVVMLANTSNVVLPAKQVEQVTGNSIGVTTGDADQAVQLPDNYSEGSLQITIDSETWQLKDTLAFSGPLDKHFIVNINQNKEAWLVFGDDIHGAIPPLGSSILATYHITLGEEGNVEQGTITNWDTVPTPPAQTPVISSLDVTNPVSATGGMNEEGIEDIRKHAPLSLRTLDRAVTLNDHKAIAELVPGVNRAAVKINQVNKNIVIYVTPDGGGVASTSLLDLVNEEFESKGMIGTTVVSQEAGETPIRLTLDVTARFRRDVTETEEDIVEALLQKYGYNNSDVNRKIRKSDIIALVDNLDKVDYLDLTILTTKPFPRILSGSNSLVNNWAIEVTSNSTDTLKWRLTVNGSNQVILFKTGEDGREYNMGTIAIGTDEGTAVQFSPEDEEIIFKVWGTFSEGDSWEFYTYAYNEDIIFEDYTLPVINVDELNLTVNKQVL